MVADCVTAELERTGHTVETFKEGSLADAALESRETVLLCSSTTGIGDVPQNVEPLYDALVEGRPDLSHIRYGVIVIGFAAVTYLQYDTLVVAWLTQFYPNGQTGL